MVWCGPPMRGQAVLDGDRTAFYRASLHSLRFCDARDARDGQGLRFGPAADARWESFRGDMGASERIDLLFRDADVPWRGAFAPRVVFDLEGVADDEPFGPAWQGIEPSTGESLWHEVAGRPAASDLKALINVIAGAWERSLSPVNLPAPTSTSRYVIAGPSAIAAALLAFATGQDLSWSDQVLVVAEHPFPRHLAALASALLSADPTHLLRPKQRPGRAARGAHLVLSADAAPEARAWAEHLAEARS